MRKNCYALLSDLIQYQKFPVLKQYEPFSDNQGKLNTKNRVNQTSKKSMWNCFQICKPNQTWFELHFYRRMLSGPAVMKRHLTKDLSQYSQFNTDKL